MKLYRIRHKVSNRWSKGGTYANSDGDNGFWTHDEEKAKIWTTLGKLRAHITGNMPNGSWDNGKDMSEWQVVIYDMISCDTKAIHEVVTPEKLIKMLKNEYE